ncbi:conserved hypothetical protein, partial [Trichinella spiralis]|uniref:hypothetical protein n=1 Tax=Trichinella spiralis TaxID=6334 RepID=UPI0001EFC859
SDVNIKQECGEQEKLGEQGKSTKKVGIGTTRSRLCFIVLYPCGLKGWSDFNHN